MTLKTNTLRDAIAFALAAGTTALVGTGAAYAQDGDDKEQELDRVNVIGTRIPRAADTEGTAPVLTLDRTAIEQTGLTSVGDVLFNITASDGGALRNITTSTNGSDGTQNISLRGLGATRTLVLVNGRRWVSPDGGAVDLNTIPISVVERIEVLKDGASAIYGSDAIAGVINVITRSNFDGAEATAYFGGYTKGDGFQQAYDFTIGSDSDRWNAVFNISYTDGEPVYQGDREISSVPVYGGGDIESGGLYGSGSNAGGNFVRCVRPIATNPATGFNFCPNATGGATGAGRTRAATTLIPGRPGTATTDFRNFISYTFDGSGSSDRYNFAPVNYLVQPIERFNVYGQGTLRLTDSINANVQAVYVKRDSNQQLAEVPLTMNRSGASGPQWAFAPTRDNVFNPYTTEDILSFNFRSLAVGPRKPYYDNDNTAVTAWLDGSFDVAGRSMYWDAGYSYLNSRLTSRGENYINLFNLRRAVGPSFRDASGLHCGTPGNVIAGCVPFNVFGGPDLGLGAGVISRAEYEAMINYISYTQNNFQENNTKDFFANLSGEIVELPAGPLGFAVGAEHRRTNFVAQPDALVAGGGSSDNFSEPTSGNIQVDEYYAELNIPILADIPGFKLLEVNLASRRSDYDSSGRFGANDVTADIGGDTSSKIGIKWQVFDDLLLRGTYSESFRAPGVTDLYQGGGESFPQAIDPCNTANFANPTTDRARCIADGVPGNLVPVAGDGVVQANTQIRSLVGGNPALKPEFGTTKSFGVVYSPSWLEGLNFTLDYYNIELEDVIAFRGAQSILNDCYRIDGDPRIAPLCSRLIVRDATGNILDLRQSNFNLAEGEVEGYDFAVSYAMPETAWGKFTFQWDNTYQTKNDLFGTVGEYNGAPTWRLRSNIVTNWQKGDFDATWSMRYYSALDESCDGGYYFEYGITPGEICNHDVYDSNGNFLRYENRIGSRIYHDLQVGWKTPWNGKVIAGARNIFAKDPPITRNSFAGSFDGAYDLPEGGFWYLQYNQKF
ncbi:MAG: TonB-dependent receptor [Lysobacter sp.]|nr:MAG: TonB-dependent receptor [Lysobacter sp.]